MLWKLRPHPLNYRNVLHESKGCTDIQTRKILKFQIDHAIKIWFSLVKRGNFLWFFCEILFPSVPCCNDWQCPMTTKIVMWHRCLLIATASNAVFTVYNQCNLIDALFQTRTIPTDCLKLTYQIAYIHHMHKYCTAITYTNIWKH